MSLYVDSFEPRVVLSTLPPLDRRFAWAVGDGGLIMTIETAISQVCIAPDPLLTPS